MQTTQINGFELAYEVQGAGEPVLLIHGAHVADGLLPLMREPALEPFRLIRHHRRGMGGSGRPAGAWSSGPDEQAADAVALLDHLGVERAHVVGHSGGGAIALALASGHTERLLSLALLEPAIRTASADEFFAWLAPLVERYETGDAAGAVRGFLAGIGDGDGLAAIERSVPGAIDQAIRDAAAFFEGDLAGAADWSFDTDDAAAIRCPVLSVLGATSTGLWVEGRQQLHEWFPWCEDADIAGTGHLLQLEQPRAVAEALAAFFRRHPGATDLAGTDGRAVTPA